MRVLCITGHSDRPEAETFIGLKNLGVDISIICPSSAPHYRRFIKSDIPVTNLHIKRRIDLGAIAKIRQIIKEKQIDILHLFNNRAVSNGILASLKLPVKIIAYRGIVANVSFLNPMSWLTYLSPRIDVIVCVAEAVRQYLLNMKCFGFHLPYHKPITIYKGHNLEWYRDPPVDLSEFGIPGHAFVVGCTANFRPRKGLHILVESAEYLPADNSIHFLLIGEMNSPTLIKQIEKSPFNDRIHLAGFRSDAPAVSAACDAVVLPALRREGLPKAVIEAMAYGVAPIVTDSGGSPELVKHNESGLVVPPGNAKAIAEAIIRLYENPALRQKIGGNAKARIAADFRIEDTIEKTYELYNILLEK